MIGAILVFVAIVTSFTVGRDAPAGMYYASGTTNTIPTSTSTTSTSTPPSCCYEGGQHCEGNRVVAEVCCKTPLGSFECRVKAPTDCLLGTKCCELFQDKTVSACGIQATFNAALCVPNIKYTQGYCKNWATTTTTTIKPTTTISSL